MNQQLDGEFATSTELNHAENGTRFLHNLIDQVIGYILVQAVMVSMIFISFTQDWMLAQVDKEGAFNLTGILISLVVFWLYFFLQEAYGNGRTIGKWITGCKVVMQNGEPATKKAIAIRSISRFIPFEAFTIFGGTILHDSLAKTEVIKL